MHDLFFKGLIILIGYAAVMSFTYPLLQAFICGGRYG